MPPFLPIPTITDVSPVSGSVLGGTEITITGVNLNATTSVTIDGVEVAEFTVVSNTSVLATTPAGTEGAKDVTLTANAFDAIYEGGFTYTSFAPEQEETPPTRGGTPTAYFVSYVSLTASLPTNVGRWTTGETTIVGCDNAEIIHPPIGNLISTQANSVSSIREAAAISSTVKYEIPSLVEVGQQFLYRFVVENRVSDSTVYGVPAGLEITNNSDGSATIAGIVGNFADVPVVGDQLGIPVKDLSESSYGSKSPSSLGFAFNIEAVPTQAAIAAGVVYDADTYSWYTGNFSLTGGETSGIDAGLTFYVGKEGEFSISPISKNWSSERDRFILFYNPKDSPHTVDGKQIVTDKTPPYTYGGNVVERFVIDNLEYLQVQKSRGYFPNC